jgi:hypothetical protein
LSAAAAASVALGAAIASGVSLRSSSCDRAITSLKKEFAALGAPLVATLISQAQSLAERDVPGALQAVRQVIDTLEIAVGSVTNPGSKSPSSTSLTSKALSGVTVQPMMQRDLTTLSQALSQLENALSKRGTSVSVGRAVQRVRLSVDRNIAVVTLKPAPPPVTSLKL